MLRKPFENFLSPDCRDKSVEVMQTGLEALKIANEAGVTICYGSDLLISMQALQTGESWRVREVGACADLIRRGVHCPCGGP